MGELYDKLLEQYGPAPTAADLHSLNVLCVRLVFLLYAEDSGVMGKDQFLNYMMSFNSENMRIALRELFDTLATPQERRDRFTDPKLAAFPYVNGGLFSDNIKADIPPFDLKAKELLLNRASRDFDWSYISPTIFGAVFESTLNPETRRKGGMHYTSIENIHRVIDPLFFSALQDEFQAVKAMPQGRSRDAVLDALQDRMASMTFLDPACGSGNFLTETFLSLRRLENKIIALRHKGEALMGEFHNPVKVSINQFHGIEINDFACTVATTAMWIAEAQTLAETERIVRRDLDFLPLKPYHNIMEGNALGMEWPETRYIIGNPPFVGARMKNKEQADDMLALFGKKWKNWGNLDYVAAWYYKAAELMGKQPGVRAALVSTNSITQGEQVAALWKPLYDRHPGLGIDFAWRTFRWDSESSDKAHVHCVIIGFSIHNTGHIGNAGVTPATTSKAGMVGNAGVPPASSTNHTTMLTTDAGETPAIQGKSQLVANAGGTPAIPAEPAITDTVKNHYRGYLPHVEGKQYQYITFRLFDSVPGEVLQRWRDELTNEEKKDPDNNKADILRKEIAQYEDTGYGSCMLADGRVAEMVQGALKHFHGKRYRLVAWCIMPNHVHMLVEIFPGHSVSDVMHSLRSYTAHEANKLLSREG